jgi:PKD repeat protein
MSTPAAALDSYNVNTTWTLQTIHIDSLDGKSFLEFGFMFHHQGAGGADPSFAVDDITVVGTPAATPPVASYTASSNTACQDSCITVTSTTTGAVDSVRWSVVPTGGATINTPTANVTGICFTSAGTFSVTLTAYNSGGSNSSTQAVSITPTPNPVIINNSATHTLSVSGAYTAYQWATGSPIPSAIPGATNSTYVYTVSGTYYVGVDSAGCQGYSTVPFVYSTTGVSNINNNGENRYWASEQSGSMILNSSRPLDEALVINIYDATGRKMLADTWSSGGSTKQLNTGYYPPGIYIIRISNSSTITVLRFLK